MITARKLRDAAFAVLLAIPTMSMTRPVATETVSRGAHESPIAAKVAVTGMTADERRAALPAAD